jgi:putative transposase
MPRQPRLDAPGLLQHVMARGIDRAKIFRDDKDRNSFLDRLADILEQTQTQCYAWALIPNHFHLLLRTGPTPLSKLMRRLMTGYAVTFNKRHKRSGHLFQNRYKSVVCEEDPYLLELVRYIHLNPLRAKLVKDLKELDKYPWTGHSAILGHRKNPLIPEVGNLKSGKKNQKTSNHSGKPDSVKRSSPSAEGGLFFSFLPEREKDNKKPRHPCDPCQKKPLAEKTIEDILLHFGESKRVARQRYRQFIKNGTDQGKRLELQGGGLVRSAGGNKVGLLGRKKEEREKGDERVLGSGDFVSRVIKKGNDSIDDKSMHRVSLEDLISRICLKFEITLDELVSKRRKRKLSRARAVLCYLAVDELNYSGEDLARVLAMSGRGVCDCRDRGQKILGNPEIIREYLS